MHRSLAILALLVHVAGCMSSAGDPGDPGSGDVPDGRICAYNAVEILICPSPARRMEYVSRFCEAAPADGASCASVLPPDEGYTTLPSGCERRVDYRLSSVHMLNEPAVGTCSEWRAWASGAIDCFDDGGCEQNETCVDGTCHCGETPIPDDERSAQTCDGTWAVFTEATCGEDGVIERVESERFDCVRDEGQDRTCVVNEDGPPCG